MTLQPGQIFSPYNLVKKIGEGGMGVVLAILCLGCTPLLEVSLRPVKVADVDAMGDVSPDGRYLTYVDWNTGDLALRDLGSGEDRHLTNKGWWAEYSLISPDGASVAYAWHRDDGVYDLHLVGIDGSAPRVLLRGDGLEYIAPRDWSPDGQQILAYFVKPNGYREIVLVSTADGSFRILKTLQQPKPGKLQFISDGRFVAYDVLIDPETGEHDVHAFAVAGGRDLTLVSSRADERILGWSPGGDTILFSSTTHGRRNLYLLPIAEGRPDGEPRLVADGLDQYLVQSLGFTAGGEYFYGVRHWVNDLYTATADWEVGTVQALEKVATRLSAASSADWSPDGRSLAWVVDRAESHHFRSLVVRTNETGEEVHLPLRILHRHGYHPRWTSAEELVIHGNNSEFHSRLFRIDASTGAVKEVVPVESTCADECAAWRWADGKPGSILWVTDGKSLEVRGPKPDHQEELFRASESEELGRLALSTDGRSLAFVVIDRESDSTRLCVLPSIGGPVRELLRVEGIATGYVGGGTRIGWSRDGSFLLLARSWGDLGVPIEIWRVPLDGMTPRKLEHSLKEPSLFGLSVHPDGRTLALAVGEPRRYEIWKLENFKTIGRRRP